MTKPYSSIALHILCGALLFGAACSDDPGEVSAPVEPQPDASLDLSLRETESRDVREVADAGQASDSADALPDLRPGPLDWTRFELRDGTAVDGEWIYTYDTSLWWNPLGEALYALFDPQRFEPFPRDTSFDFLRASDVVATSDTDRPSDAPTYAEFTRARGIQVSASPLSEPAYVITANNGYHLEEDGFGDFAWDFVYSDSDGARWTGDGRENEDYFVWGESVYAPVSGYVVEVLDSAPDNAPGAYPEDAVNNLVGIHLGGRFYLYILHFRQGSIPVEIAVDTWVDVGDYLGEVGNSGVTLEPHLHLVLLWYDVDEERSYSIPVEFESLEVSPAWDGPWSEHENVAPVAGDFVR